MAMFTTADKNAYCHVTLKTVHSYVTISVSFSSVLFYYYTPSPMFQCSVETSQTVQNLTTSLNSNESVQSSDRHSEWTVMKRQSISVVNEYGGSASEYAKCPWLSGV